MNKTVKSFSVQVKQYSLVLIVFFLLVETIIEIMRKPIFTEKFYCSQQKLFSWLVKNRFSQLSDIPSSENSFSIKWKCFFNEFFIPASGNEFSVQQKQYCFIQSSAEDFKICGQQHFQEKNYFCSWKLNFFGQ